jgi:CheY-like chemotaxis protein
VGSVIVHTVPSSKHKGSGDIVIIDDEEVLRDILQEMLKSLGYTTICKNEG